MRFANHRSLRLLTACFVALAASATASDRDPVGPSESGWVDRARKPVPDTERRRSAGPFCASLLVSDDPKLFEKWGEPSEVFAYDGIDSIRKGSYFVAVVAFANPSVDASGDAHLAGDFRLFRPDGSLYGEMTQAPAWDGPPPRTNILELSTKYLMGRIEPEDPIGTYQVVAMIQDRVSGHALELKAPLTVEPPMPAEFRQEQRRQAPSSSSP